MRFKEIFRRRLPQEIAGNDMSKIDSAGLRILRFLGENGNFTVQNEGRLIFYYSDNRSTNGVRVADYESRFAASNHLEKVRASVVNPDHKLLI